MCNKVPFPAEAWADKLLAVEGTNIGDIVRIGSLSVRIELDEHKLRCDECAFNDGVTCLLLSGNWVTPCSPFNNAIGKPVVYIKQNKK